MSAQQAQKVEITSIQRRVESMLFQRCVPLGGMHESIKLEELWQNLSNKKKIIVPNRTYDVQQSPVQTVLMC